VSRAALLALSLALAACGVRGPPRPPHLAEAPADAGAPTAQPLEKPCAEADGGCAP
jgi:predicted small lipoprotein YifL